MIEPLGPQILTTFSFSPERSTMRMDVAVLVCLAAGLATTSLLVFFLATRCVCAAGGEETAMIHRASSFFYPLSVFFLCTRGCRRRFDTECARMSHL